MLTIALGRAVGLVLLYFSTRCCCMSLTYWNNEVTNRSVTSNQRIQICGPALTSLIIHICEGDVFSPNEDYGGTTKPDFDYIGIVEKCCKNLCNPEVLSQHCGKKSLLKRKPQANQVTREQPNRGTYESLNELPSIVKGSSTSIVDEDLPRRRTSISSSREIKVRVKKKKKLRKTRGRNKQRHLFKLPYIYKSFGDFLLNLDHHSKSQNKIRKIMVERCKTEKNFSSPSYCHRSASIDKDNRKNVAPFEVGTIKPESFGGDPFVVGSRYGSINRLINISGNDVNTYRVRRKSFMALY